MYIPTDAELDRLAEMLDLPPLPAGETPDPAVTERVKAAIRAAMDRPPHQDGDCRCRLEAL